MQPLLSKFPNSSLSYTVLKKRFLTCTYMEMGKWYYLNVVPRYVFVNQSKALMELFAFFMIVIFSVIAAVWISVFHRRSRIIAMERKHRA